MGQDERERNELYCLHRVLEGVASVGEGYRKSSGGGTEFGGNEEAGSHLSI